jgi:hypothetical protein
MVGGRVFQRQEDELLTDEIEVEKRAMGKKKAVKQAAKKKARKTARKKARKKR